MLQAIFEIRFANGEWKDYCREPVMSETETRQLLDKVSAEHSTNRAFRVRIEDWENGNPTKFIGDYDPEELSPHDRSNGIFLD